MAKNKIIVFVFDWFGILDKKNPRIAREILLKADCE